MIEEHVVDEAFEALEEAARFASTITYSELGKTIGIYHFGNEMNSLLDAVDRRSFRTFNCLATSLVVQKGDKDEKGSPGRGFYRMARQLGFEVEDFDLDFWQSQRRKTELALG